MYKIKVLLGRAVIFSLYFLIRLFAFLPTKKSKKMGNTVVLTGNFYSKNWVNAHLLPIVTCSSVKHVYLVSEGVDYDVAGLTVIPPSALASKVLGSTLSRLLTSFICAIKNRADYIGGFHILFNGTFAILFSKILRCRSLYFCGGGVTETLETGHSENSFFRFIRYKDSFLTRTICNIIKQANAVMTMGSGAKTFFINNQVKAENIHIISGSIDKERFYPADPSIEKNYDLVLTARLSKVKQVNLLLDVLVCLKNRGVSCNTLIIGDGPLLTDLKEYAESIGVSEMVNFVGHQDDVLSWLHLSKIYILTSRSEGLALSMLEGLKTGLPAIVPNVGDLSDVLIDGFNGALIENHSVSDFATQISRLLSDAKLLETYSANGIASTKRFDLECVQEQWNRVFYGNGE